ncbi:MAG: hypothetical protein DWQ04_00010 [Chloroflexi bacterium]|nr:MAG: hypothetical protein DWQ04_00010 [Chloroflexota bacterium]
MKNQIYKTLFLIVAVFVLLFVEGQVRSVLAHTRVEVGPYAIVVGWLVEPPVIGERNAVIVEVHEDDAPVVGVEATLDAEFVYGGQVFRANLNPTETPGLYTAEIFPTVRGQYAVRLFGSIGDLEIDEVLEPEEVFPASRIQFPEAQPEPRDLQQQITMLQAEVRSSRTLAMVGLGTAALGVIMGAIGLITGRRRS